MHVRFVVNPVAGRRASVPYVEQVVQRLEAQGLQTSTVVTRFAGDAEDHVRRLPAEVDRVIVVGGDGTLCEVINGLPPLRCPVGVIPMGTANLVARETRMPLVLDADSTATALMAAAPWRVDLMKVVRPEGPPRLSLATVGVGLDGEIVRVLEDVRSTPGSGGYTRWVTPIVDTLKRFPLPNLRVHVDECRTYAARGAIVQNTRNYGGLFQLSPTSAMDSGTLDVLLLKINARRDIVRLITGGLLRRVHKYKDMQIVRGDRIRIEAIHREPVQSDGDFAGYTNLDITRQAGALDLLRAPPK